LIKGPLTTWSRSQTGRKGIGGEEERLNWRGNLKREIQNMSASGSREMAPRCTKKRHTQFLRNFASPPSANEKKQPRLANSGAGGHLGREEEVQLLVIWITMTSTGGGDTTGNLIKVAGRKRKNTSSLNGSKF